MAAVVEFRARVVIGPQKFHSLWNILEGNVTKKIRGCGVLLLATYGLRFACLKEWLMWAAHGISSSRLPL